MTDDLDPPHPPQPDGRAAPEAGSRLYDTQGVVDDDSTLARILATTAAALWMIDEHNRTCLVNDALCELLGYAPAELMGRSLFDFMDEEGRRVTTRNLERRKAGIKEHHTFRFLHSSGAEVWTRLIAGPVTRPDGTYMGAVAWVTEITAEQAEDEEVRFREALLSAAVDNSPTGIVIVEAPQGTVRVANPAARAALPGGHQQLVGRRIDEIAASDWAHRPDGSPIPRGEGPLYRALAKGELTRDEEMLVRYPDGSERLILNSAAPVRGPEGVVHAGVLIFADITEHRRLEQERAELERRMIESARLESLGRLAGGVAHDFNNLLATLMGRAELALFQLEPGHPARAQLGKILETVQKSADLTRKMLAYSGRTPLDAGPLSLDDVVRAHEGLLRASLPRETRLEVSLAGQLPPVLGDAAQLRHLITELVEVAAGRDLTGPRTVRLVTASTVLAPDPEATHPSTRGLVGEVVCIGVADDGPPIPPAVRQRLLDPYPSGSRRLTGGYDLSLILGIVRGHGGVLELPQRDEGNLVVVHLPATEHESTPMVEATSGLHLLVVDDEPEVRDTLCELLEALGHHAQGAASGREALSLVVHQHFDLVILDLTMPDLDGAEVAQRLAGIAPELPVVVCSGWAPADVLPRFKDSPPAGLLQKPVLPKHLVAVIEKVVQSAG